MLLSPDAVRDALWPGFLAAGILCSLLPWLPRNHTPTRMALTTVTAALMLQYITWRFFETLPPLGFSADWIAGVIFAAVEALAITGVLISLVFMSRTSNRTAEVEAHLPELMSRPVLPLVDVFICTYNEEQAILERTIAGALNLDYPNFRLWILDDGRREWLRRLCRDLGCGYITRTGNANAKAGNINNALAYVMGLSEPPEFVSILDADFVPLPTFLKRTMSLFHDGRVGVVQTPQHFLNPDPIQMNLSASRVWPDEQRYFFDIIMPSRDAWNSAFCCGTSSVIRVRPLIQMGGIPIESVTEDYLLTLRLKERGYRTVYLNEALSFGLAPEGLKEYVTQRSRWCLGLMQICRGPSGPLSRIARISLLDRIFLVESFLYWTAAHAFRLLSVIIPIAYLLFGIVAVDVGVGEFLAHFLPYFIWHSIILAWLTEGRVIPIMSDIAQLMTAPAAMRATVAGLFRPRRQKFKVTAKGGERGSRFVEWPMLRIFLLLLVLTLAGIVVYFETGVGPDYPGASILALFWSWYNILILTIACYACIEQPRPRKSDRFHAADQVILTARGAASRSKLTDISVSGAALVGEAPAGVGEQVSITLAPYTVSATVTRSGQGFFAVRFGDTLAERVALARYLYSGRYSRALLEIRWASVMRAVSARLFG